jgi:RNA-directed DNA polymerase
METLHEAYRMAKSNKAAPGIDEVTFEAIGESGEECFLRQIRDELVTHTYRPMREPQHRNAPPLLCYNVYT